MWFWRSRDRAAVLMGISANLERAFWRISSKRKLMSESSGVVGFCSFMASAVLV